MENAELYALPPYVIYFVVVAGAVLAITSPRWLFNAVLLALVSADLKSYTFTRLAGPFFNLFDLLLAFGLLACYLKSDRNQRGPPALVYWIAADIAFSGLSTFFDQGYNVESLRMARHAFNLVIFWVIGHYCFKTRRDSTDAVWIILVGCLIQSINQCIYVATISHIESSPNSWRTIRFLNSGLIVVPVCFLWVPLSRSLIYRGIMYLHIGISAIALILTQTRSYWIPQATILALGLFVFYPRATFRIIINGLIMVIATAFLFDIVAPHTIDFYDIVFHSRISDFSSGTGREETVVYELDAWLTSNLVFGRGLGFNYSSEFQRMGEIAWAHVGYLAYLSNLGVIGFILYAWLLPKMVFGRIREVLRSASDDSVRLFTVLTACMFVFALIESALSTGLLYGTIYGLNIMLMAGVTSMAREPQEESSASSVADDRLGQLA